MKKWEFVVCVIALFFNGCESSEESLELGVVHSALRLETQPYSQSGGSWGGKRLGRPGCPDTMASDGCLVTSLAMMYNYYQPGYTTPGKLNSDRNFTGGNPCFIDYNNTDTLDGISPLRRLDHWSSDIAYDYLSKGYPVIARTWEYGGHFFLVIGYNDSGDFILNDPITGTEELLSRTRYTRKLDGMRLFTGPSSVSPTTHSTEYNRQSPDGLTEVHPGDTVDLIVSYKNTGSRAWSNDIGSSDYVELRSVDSGGNPARSWLCHSHWLDGGPTEPGDCIRVINPNAATVNPGENAWFEFRGVIPSDVELGHEYRIYFRPHHANGGYIDGWGGMHFRFTVSARPDCSDGETTREGCGNCGYRTFTCVGGHWNSGSCLDQGECARDITRTTDCGDCGEQDWRCSDDCEWERVRSCETPVEVCDLDDNDCDGHTDEGLSCYYDVRRCFRDYGDGDHDHYFEVLGACATEWTDDGIKFRTFASNPGGLAQLHRRYNSSIHDHMISVNGDEGSPDYIADGNVGFCSPTNLGGMLSLWEVYSVERRNHFHTTDTGERDRAYYELDYNDNSRVDVRECYVWPR